MKRMYVVLAFMLLISIWTVVAIGQMTSSHDSIPSQGQSRQPFDRMKRRMELREEMHRRIREKLLHGRGADQDLFKDLEQQFDDTMADSLSGLSQMESVSNFKSEWLEDQGSRTLVITPMDQKQKINIDVNANVITIKGESQEKTSTSTYASAFTNSFPVPVDCDGTKVKMDTKDGKLLVVLPYKTMKANPISPPVNKERQPLPPSESDVQI